MLVHVLFKRKHRGLTYLPHGQSCETWLPTGAYWVEGECTVIDRDGVHQPALKLLGTADNAPPLKGETWYVGRNFKGD